MAQKSAKTVNCELVKISRALEMQESCALWVRIASARAIISFLDIMGGLVLKVRVLKLERGKLKKGRRSSGKFKFLVSVFPFSHFFSF